MTLLSDNELNEHLNAITATLIKEVPKAAQTIKPSESAYCLFLQYVDFSADDDFAPFICWGTESVRQELISEHGDDAWQYIWSPQELESVADIPTASVGDNELHQLCRDCYQHFFSLCGDETPDDEEEEMEILLPFRKMIQQVSLKLNAIDWSQHFDVTDDFIIAPLNWTGQWTDIEEGVPREKLELLKQRNLFRFLSDLYEEYE